MPKIYDISLTLTPDLMVWPGSTHARFEKTVNLDKGDIANVTSIEMCTHTGTHVDAPCHFISGAKSAETLPLDVLIGPVLVVEVAEEEAVTAATFRNANITDGIERTLIKSRNSKVWNDPKAPFDKKYVGITADGAEYLVEQGIKLIGVDGLSVAPFEDLIPTHELLLKAEVVILEGIDLSNVEAGEYTLYCLPLKIAGSDGAPARTILVE